MVDEVQDGRVQDGRVQPVDVSEDLRTLTAVLELRRLTVLGRHGALPEERQRRQPFEVDLRIGVDCSKCSVSDQLSDTVDYGALIAAVASVIEGPHVNLLEVLARRIAETILGMFPTVLSAGVAVRKTRPPVPYSMLSAGVALTLHRPSTGS